MSGYARHLGDTARPRAGSLCSMKAGACMKP